MGVEKYSVNTDPTLAPNDEHFMALAMEQAQLAAQQGEVPVGAVVVQQGKVIGCGYNQPITCLLYTSPSPRDGLLSRMPSSA